MLLVTSMDQAPMPIPVKKLLVEDIVNSIIHHPLIITLHIIINIHLLHKMKAI